MSERSECTCEEKLDAAIESLIYVFSSRDGLMRKSAREALVVIGRPAIPSLIQALADKNKNVRWESAKALEEIGDPSAAQALVARLKQDNFGIRWIAAESLVKFGKDGLRPLFLELLQNPDSGFLRDGAHHVLYSIAGKDPSLQGILSPVIDGLGAVSGAKDVVPYIQAALEALDIEAESVEEDELLGDS
ncbi:HEAT repeat domain-containing protein [bacterium]|nr:HEAT repeat domain-containing protein [bacterium]